MKTQKRKELGNSGKQELVSSKKTDLFPVCHPKRETDPFQQMMEKSLWRSCPELSEICKYDCRMGKSAALDGAWRDCTEQFMTGIKNMLTMMPEWMRCDFPKKKTRNFRPEKALEHVRYVESPGI